MKTKKIIIVLCAVSIILAVITYLNESLIVRAVEGPDVFKILVDVEESKMYVFKNNELFKTYKCAGGKEKTPSPIGSWRIINKGKWGEGFGGRWMRIQCTMGRFWNTSEQRRSILLDGQVHTDALE